MAVSREDVLSILKSIADPASDSDIVAAGVVRALTVDSSQDGTNIRFVLEVDPSRAEAYKPVQAQAETQLRALVGAGSVSVVLTAHQKPAAPPNLKPNAPSRSPATQAGPDRIPGVNHVIAIASGKGGVGKSTLSSNLACALAAQGRRVGLLDADVYGPSQPRMLGVSGRPSSPDGKTILPMRNHGVTLMSMGLMTNADQAVVWRGPMLMGALQQMLMQVQWGALDVLLVDLPPGTGDVQMTLAQKTVVDGALIVSTPQDVALLDARKGIDMFKQLNVPILGMIENMSTHLCTNCGHEEHIFGHGGVATEAAQLDVPLLAEVPLSLDIRLASDSGAPIVVTAPDGPQAAAYHSIASQLVARGVA